MPNPYLPSWEYIPDGEPRVFGDRVYIYGSHDKVNSDHFCDYKLKVWSASVDNLKDWTCHGHCFHSRDDRDHTSDVDWTDHLLYAPDVVEKDGKYYLYAYLVGAKGCVAVSDRPEGPFSLLSTYKFEDGESSDGNEFVDPGTLVDDDGRVYTYCGFLGSYMAEMNPDNMYEVISGSYKEGIIPKEAPYDFFEACSPRKVGDTYYLIYSPTPQECSRLVYATSKSPRGPFEYGGIIVDNGVDYPGGNDHGSICLIKDQWYIFYHRMTNNSIMSRRACVEKIEILEDGSIPQVAMTSLGFEESLNPYEPTPGEFACHLSGGCFITERNLFERPVTFITHGSTMGYRTFDFGEDYASKTMKFAVKVRGLGAKSKIRILMDHPSSGIEIGTCEIGRGDGIYEGIVKQVTGRHDVYLVVEHSYESMDFAMPGFEVRHLFELETFVFLK